MCPVSSEDYFEAEVVMPASKSFSDNKKLTFRATAWEISSFILRLCKYLRLLCLLILVLVIFNLSSYLLIEPVYVAHATIGPPNPSPISSMVTGGTPLGGGIGVASRLLGSGGSGNDTFSEFKQLLYSPRLATELVDKDKFLQQVYPTAWDERIKSWRPRGPVFAVKAFIYRILHQPVMEHPDSDALGAYLNNNLEVVQAAGVGASQVVSVAGLGTNYITISLKADTPEHAEILLGIILRRADELIRQEQLQDVEARIAYIKRELSDVTMMAQRGNMIDLLASQQQLKTLLVADKRFAHVLVSMPHASYIPTSPMDPVKSTSLAIAFSFALWIALVLLAENIEAIGRQLCRLTS
jgi:hypothetical protein